MKTYLSKIIMPIAAITLAIGGSFVSHASEKSSLVKVTGYFHPNGTPICVPIKICNTIGFVLCTTVYQGRVYQVFGKVSPNDTVCPVTLFENF